MRRQCFRGQFCGVWVSRLVNLESHWFNATPMKPWWWTLVRAVVLAAPTMLECCLFVRCTRRSCFSSADDAVVVLFCAGYSKQAFKQRPSLHYVCVLRGTFKTAVGAAPSMSLCWCFVRGTTRRYFSNAHHVFALAKPCSDSKDMI